MTLRILATGLLAATIIAGNSGLASAQSQSTDCDLKGSTASVSGERSSQQQTSMLSRDDWAEWTKEQTAKPATEAGKPTTQELAEQHKELLKQEKAEATGGEAQKSAAKDTPSTTGIATPRDRAARGADDPEAEANTPKSTADGSEHYSAPSGGFSSGAHIGNESPTDTGNSAGGMEESKSAERMNPTDC